MITTIAKPLIFLGLSTFFGIGGSLSLEGKYARGSLLFSPTRSAVGIETKYPIAKDSNINAGIYGVYRDSGGAGSSAVSLGFESESDFLPDVTQYTRVLIGKETTFETGLRFPIFYQK